MAAMSLGEGFAWKDTSESCTKDGWNKNNKEEAKINANSNSDTQRVQEWASELTKLPY